jgi:fibronectin-binding autotransporter adhesin
MKKAMTTRSVRGVIEGLVAVAGLAAASGAMAQDRVWNGTTGDWSVASNWMPADVPDTAGEHARILAAGGYTVTANGNFTIGSLGMTNPTGALAIANSNRLNILSGIANDSTITVNATAGASQTLIQFLASQALTGGGAIVLNANAGNLDTAYLYFNGGGEVLSQAAGHTIRGTGNIYVSLANAGTVDANVAGRTLAMLQTNKSNSNLMTATNGGVLVVNGIGLTQTGAGRLEANGGTVRIFGSTIAGGAVLSTNGGITNVETASTFTDVAFSGPINVSNSSNLRLSGARTFNDGTITVNPTSGASQTLVQVLNSTSMEGSGEVVLNATAGNLDTSYIYFNGGGEVLTHGESHTIRGTGRVYVNTVNNGLISADRMGRALHLISQPKTNNNVMQAVGGGFLDITVPITQGMDGLILANDGWVRMSSASVAGGSVTAQGVDGLIEVNGSTVDFNGVTLTGPLTVNNAAVLRTTSGFVNNGTITINTTSGASATALQSLASNTISGTGTIVLNASPNLDTAYLTYNGGGEVLTLGSGQTVRGTGRVYVNTTNNGVISADVSGRVINLLGTPKTNNNLMRAMNGGFLDITGIVVNQAPGATILGDASRVRMSGSVINNGMVTAQGSGGLIEVNGSTVDFNGVTLTGPLSVNNATSLRTSAGFVNNGTITINPTAGASVTNLQVLASTTIGGTGAIVLNASTNLDTAYLYFNGGGEVLTLGGGQTVRGTGQVYVNTTNNGLISADVSGRVLALVGTNKTNNNVMQATNDGILDIVGIGVTQGGSTSIRATNGLVRLNNATVTGGRLLATGATGRFEVLPGTSTLQGVDVVGPMDVLNGSTLRTTVGFTNNGTITINPTSGNSGTILQALASTTIDGSGTILLNANSILDTAYLVYNGGGEVLTLGPSQTLAGRGRVYIQTVVRGRIAPGAGLGNAGQIDTRTRLTLASDATADFEIGGTGTNEYDRITGTGVVDIQNATIRITTFNGFNPTIGQTFDVISGPAITGQFCGHLFPRGWAVQILPNAVRVRFGGCVADVDGGTGCGVPDGGVTIDDLLFYIDLFQLGDVDADIDDGSFTGNTDGGVTIDDLLYYLFRFEEGC